MPHGLDFRVLLHRAREARIPFYKRCDDLARNGCKVANSKQIFGKSRISQSISESNSADESRPIGCSFLAKLQTHFKLQIKHLAQVFRSYLMCPHASYDSHYDGFNGCHGTKIAPCLRCRFFSSQLICLRNIIRTQSGDLAVPIYISVARCGFLAAARVSRYESSQDAHHGSGS
jgi:hypothetical protein